MMSIRRPFNLGRYLDQQLPASHPQIKRGPRAWRGHDNGKDYALPSVRRENLAQRFRGWAIRLNDRIERYMDSTDWMAFELKLERIGGCLLTGVGIYFVATLANAWLSGHFNLGGR